MSSAKLAGELSSPGAQALSVETRQGAHRLERKAPTTGHGANRATGAQRKEGTPGRVRTLLEDVALELVFEEVQAECTNGRGKGFWDEGSVRANVPRHERGGIPEVADGA